MDKPTSESPTSESVVRAIKPKSNHTVRFSKPVMNLLSGKNRMTNEPASCPTTKRGRSSTKSDVNAAKRLKKNSASKPAHTSRSKRSSSLPDVGGKRSSSHSSVDMVAKKRRATSLVSASGSKKSRPALAKKCRSVAKVVKNSSASRTRRSVAKVAKKWEMPCY